MKNRLIEFLAYKDLGQNKFEEICGIANGTVSNMRDNMTVKTLMKISAAFPDLDITWLLTGKGEMSHNEDTMTTQAMRPNIPIHDELIFTLKKSLGDKEETIADKNEIIALLKQRISELEKDKERRKFPLVDEQSAVAKKGAGVEQKRKIR
jgi:transcriptional regulator with XRE-family HTH domain